MLLLYRAKPPTPPSFTSSIKRENFILATKLLLKNKNYLLFVSGSSLLFGSFVGGLLVSISFFLRPFGFKESDTSKIIAIIPITGGIGVYIGQKILRKTKQYKKFILYVIAAIPITLFIVIALMETE